MSNHIFLLQKLPDEDKDRLVELDKVVGHIDGMLTCENGLDGETLQVNDNASQSETLSVSGVDIPCLF